MINAGDRYGALFFYLIREARYGGNDFENVAVIVVDVEVGLRLIRVSFCEAVGKNRFYMCLSRNQGLKKCLLELFVE